MKKSVSLSIIGFLLFGMLAFCFVPSVSAAEVDPSSDVSSEPASGMYYELYDLLAGAFYGSTAVTGAQDLVLTTLVTLLLVFCFSLPFLALFCICVSIFRVRF